MSTCCIAGVAPERRRPLGDSGSHRQLWCRGHQAEPGQLDYNQANKISHCRNLISKVRSYKKANQHSLKNFGQCTGSWPGAPQQTLPEGSEPRWGSRRCWSESRHTRPASSLRWRVGDMGTAFKIKFHHNLCCLSSLILRLAVTVRQHASFTAQSVSQSVSVVSCKLFYK